MSTPLSRFFERTPPEEIEQPQRVPHVEGELPLLGHMVELVKDGRDPGKTMSRWHEKYGPRFTANIPGLGPLLVTNDPDDIPLLTRRPAPQLTKRDDAPFPWSEVWAKHPERAMTYTWMTDQAYIDGIGVFRKTMGTADVAIPRFGSHIMWNVNRMMGQFTTRHHPNTKVVSRLKELFFCFLIDPCIQMTCGKDLRFTTRNPANFHPELRAFYRAVLDLGQNALKVAQNPINHVIKTKDYEDCETYWASLYDSAQKWYDALKVARDANGGLWPDSVSRDKSIFLDGYEDYFEKNLCDEKRLVCNIVEFVIGTADPGAQLMENILFQLARNPDAQEVVYEEIVGVFGKDAPIESLDLQQWNSLRRFQAFIAETCRFMPLFTIHMRRTVEETTLADSSVVPAGTKVIFNYAGMSKSDDNYPRADEFLPERFLDLPQRPKRGERGQCPFSAGKINNIEAVVPFGVGDRACAGIGWAQAITGMAVASIVRQYKVRYQGPLNLPYRHSTPNHPPHPLDAYFRFQNRDESNR
jgi:cytochrome P450